MAFRPTVSSDFARFSPNTADASEGSNAPPSRGFVEPLSSCSSACSAPRKTPPSPLDPELSAALHPLFRIPDIVIRIPPKGSFLLEGVRFNSRAEAAAGVLMARYIPGFELVSWKTFQVPIGVGSGGDLQTVDFRFRNFFIEYHPPRVKRFPANRRARRRKRNEPRQLRELRRQLSEAGNRSWKRKKLLQQMREYLGEGYRRKREMQLRNSPLVQKFTLIVVASPQELYQKVVLRFGRRNLPSPERFVSLFRELMAQVQDVTLDNERYPATKSASPCRQRKLQSNHRR